MYIPSSARQTYVFLLCIGFGFLLGIFYHLVRFVRKSFFRCKKAIFVQDVLYCVVSTFGIFCFLLCCNDGEIRLFTLGGFALGLFVYYVTFGVFVARFLDKISSPISAFFRALSLNGKRIAKKLKKSRKNSQNNSNST